MQKPLLILMSLALLGAACQSDPGSTGSVAAPDGVASDVEPADGEPADAEAASVSSPAICGFGAGVTPVNVEVEQILGDGREENPSALSNPMHPSFGEPLVDINRIISGGPPPDGIPPIDTPVFQTASTVDWIQCTEPVLSLAVNGEARAYPIQIMTWHELVNDTFGDVPVTVSYCPLCNSALAYRRDLDGRTVTFGTSGMLFNSSLVMYDRETESLWTHFNGAAVVGELVGSELELLPMQTTSWASFLQANPDGLVLTRDTGHSRRYGDNPYAGYDNVETSPFLLDQAADPRLAAKERIVAIRRGDDSVAVVLEGLAAAGALEVEVDGSLLSAWHLPGTATALEQSAIADGRDVGAVGVYVPMVDSQTLTFSRSDDELFTDAETGSRWTIQGLAVDGPLAGEQLEPVEHLDTFWFALAAFEPDTRILAAP